MNLVLCIACVACVSGYGATRAPGGYRDPFLRSDGLEGEVFSGQALASGGGDADGELLLTPSFRSAAAARNMPGELFSSDVGALDFSGPALDSGAVDGRYWFFSQAAPVLTKHKKVDFPSEKTFDGESEKTFDGELLMTPMFRSAAAARNMPGRRI